MEKTLRIVDEKHGIVQITTPDERWYAKPKITNGLPGYEFVPSVTWITGFYPKGIGFMQWLAKKGWDQAEAIKAEAGDKGTIIHHACGKLIADGRITIDTLVPDRDGVEREMTPDEYDAVLSFARWFKEFKPDVVAIEEVVWGDGYAGTIDLRILVDGVPWIVDIKTSANVYPSHEIQVSAYAAAMSGDWKDANLAILQLGYKRNKNGYKWTPVDNQYGLFKAVKEIWAKETQGEQPLQRDMPLVVVLEGQLTDKVETKVATKKTK